MSDSHIHNPGKLEEVNASPIGFRFYANDEELEELQSNKNKSANNFNDIGLELKNKTALLSTESLDIAKSEEDKNVALGDSFKDNWNLLGRRSTSVDSTYESPFANPIETWRKINVLKEKITKTVEEKISEMKMDKNVLNKSNRSKLLNSKENSSVSDSEDTSESSKMSEHWKDTEDLNLSSSKLSNLNSDSLSSILESAVENVKMELENREIEAELRNRKSSKVVSELADVSDIKIVTAKSELEEKYVDENFTEEIESGVEANENLDNSESDSLDCFDDPSTSPGDGADIPPGGNNMNEEIIKFLISCIHSRTFFYGIFGISIFIFLPLTDFIKGFLSCTFLMAIYGKFSNFFVIEEGPMESETKTVVDYDKPLPPLKVPHFKPVKGVWMNEYVNDSYDPDYYSVTQTLPVYLEIENCFIILSRTKNKINKRATYDEPEYKLSFVSQRTYNISGCDVFLMPDGLTRKRLFSKKYPIVIFLKSDSFISEKKKKREEERDSEDVSEVSFEPSDHKNKSSLYLFARCDRQKEEWYRRLRAATKSHPILERSSKFKKNKTDESERAEENFKRDDSFENLYFDDDMNTYEEYLRYMSHFVDIEKHLHHKEWDEKDQDSFSKKHKMKRKDIQTSEEEVEHIKPSTINIGGKKGKIERSNVSLHEKDETDQEETVHPYQVQWLNAFVNRILFDIFRSPYWLNKIQEKVERKLNSIRMPYYVEDIELIEMNLGKSGPKFHRVSQPYLDYRGLWFDMETTFDGLIKVTIQTQLNLVKLQKGFEEEDIAKQQLHDKPEKGKKSPAKEVKEHIVAKNPNEKSKKSLNKKSGEPEKTESQPLKAENAENQTERKNISSEENKFIDEVAQFVEIAVEESLKENDHEKSKKKSVSYSHPRMSKKLKSPIYDSELEDSAESSEDEDEEEDLSQQGTNRRSSPGNDTPVGRRRSGPKRDPKNRRSSKKIFRVFENVAQSKYFKTMAQSKYVQKAIAGVSATKLKLTLEIKSCAGTLTVNIPPPPSDRFWYGFREMPKMVFSASPKIGDKSLRFAHIKHYLQKKILHEIKKVMVFPNMIDFVLPTSSPARSISSLQIGPTELDDQEATPSE